MDGILEAKAGAGTKASVLEQLAALKKQRENAPQETSNRSHKDRDER